MKTKEELNALKEEVETLSRKLAELSEEEFAQVSGGARTYYIFYCDNPDCPASHGEKVSYNKTHCTICGSPGHVE